MPDRAVVDDELCPQRVGVAGSWHHWSAPGGNDGLITCLDCGAVKEAQPRALVALSEDRQWLVVLTPGEYSWRSFGIWHRQWDRHWGFKPRGEWIWRRVDGVKDTGQSADEVLAEWLEGRGG